MIPRPTFIEERSLLETGYDFIAGIDEVGKGCFAGPLFAAVVLFNKLFYTSNHSFISQIHDSKLLTSQKRSFLAPLIKTHALFSAIVSIDVDAINTNGIEKANTQAILLLMENTMEQFRNKKICFLIDGRPKKSLFTKSFSQHYLIKADQKSITVASASIIAKVKRDSYMTNISSNYPLYFFSQNKGYGTAKHRESITNNGICPLHRVDFVQSYLTKRKK